MATGGQTSGSTETRIKSLTCSLCLDIFVQPKLLPCHHTFCLKCLENLTSTLVTPTFPCPQCRSEVSVPPEGVSAFQSNFYIHAEDLDIAREGTQCLAHPKQELDLYCVGCKEPVCLKCVLTKHKSHDTKDLAEVAQEVREELSKGEDKVKGLIDSTKKKMEALEVEQQALEGKKVTVKTAIRNKHAVVTAIVDKYRDELLDSVDAVCSGHERKTSKDIATSTSDLQDLCQLLQQLQDTLTDGSASRQVTLARQMTERKGQAQVLENVQPQKSKSFWGRQGRFFSSAERDIIARPVFNSTLSRDSLMKAVQDLFGTVESMEMKPTSSEVVVEEFTCKEDADEVFSLCPLINGDVRVSYLGRGLENKTFSDCFEASGVCKETQESGGKSSWKSRDKGGSLMLTSSRCERNTYSKSVSVGNSPLKLCNTLHGTADIKKEEIISEKPLRTKSVNVFTIQVGPHRAFDVNHNQQFYVVVEEAQEGNQQRQVRLYKKNKESSVATYDPCSQLFNPSDVAFCIVDRQEMLMIADEGGDSIHIARVCERDNGVLKLKFIHYLAPGSPLLVQPTALNTDHQGRLWVACRGGRILTMTIASIADSGRCCIS